MGEAEASLASEQCRDERDGNLAPLSPLLHFCGWDNAGRVLFVRLGFFGWGFHDDFRGVDSQDLQALENLL